MILSLLEHNGAMHGYALLQALKEEEPTLAPSEGTLYESLKTLEKLGVVESFWSDSPRPRKYYRLTRLGRDVLYKLSLQARAVARILHKYSVGVESHDGE